MNLEIFLAINEIDQHVRTLAFDAGLATDQFTSSFFKYVFPPVCSFRK